MPRTGARTTTTKLWLLDEDVAALDVAVRGATPEPWRCSPPGPAAAQRSHLHRTLPEALSCGGVQAFLSLPFAEHEGESLAEVHYLHTRRVSDDALGRLGDHLRAGWLSVRWSTGDVGEAEPLLVQQQRAVWGAMRSVTQPCLLRHLHTGATHGRARIGAVARTLVQEQGLTLALGYQPYRLAETRGQVPLQHPATPEAGAAPRAGTTLRPHGDGPGAT